MSDDDEISELSELHAEILALGAHVDQLATELKDAATSVHRKQAIMGEIKEIAQYVHEIAEDFGYAGK